jgi:hypothetical protein
VESAGIIDLYINTEKGERKKGKKESIGFEYVLYKPPKRRLEDKNTVHTYSKYVQYMYIYVFP